MGIALLAQGYPSPIAGCHALTCSPHSLDSGDSHHQRPAARYAVVTSFSKSIRRLVRIDLIDDEIRVVASKDIRKVKNP